MARSCSISAEVESLKQILGLMDAFKKSDKNHDGFISIAELGGLLKSLGYEASEKALEAVKQHGDTNEDGLLSLQKFLSMNTQNIKIGDQVGTCLRNAFQVIDVNGDKHITGKELYSVMSSNGLSNDLCLEDCEAIIASLDDDRDGKVSLENLKMIADALIKDI